MGTVEPVAPVTHLSDAKRKLLDKLLRGEMKIAPKRLPPISPRTSEGPFPLSHTQQQIWLHAQMAPDLPVYTEPFTVHRRGPLDADVLERCLVEIIRRHEIWRTTFDTVDGRPVQVVRPAPSHFPLSA